nr:hypothetical protein [Microcystis wesenbergii]
MLSWPQRSLVAARIANPDLPDILLLLEHPPFYTLATDSDVKFVKFNLDKFPARLRAIACCFFP